MQTEAERTGQQHAQPAQATHSAHTEQQPLARAEDLVNQASERASTFFALAGLRMQQMLVRAREEAEDMWAEAQDLRRTSRRHPRKPGSTQDSAATS